MIKISHLTKKYGDSVIFENAEYTFPDKGLVCLLGASGCGKSTLLNLIAGFDSDYSGTIDVNGLSINNLNSEELCVYRKQNIGFVFQNYHLLKGYSVIENILLPCELDNSNEDESLKYADKLLQLFGIADKKKQKIENLSGGQKQRVAIARALMSNPNIILADEPTGALDRGTSTEIMSLLKEISKEKLVVVITHDKKICDFAEEIITIHDGKINCEKKSGISDVDNVIVNNQTSLKSNSKALTFKKGFKNFSVHLKRYVAIGLTISISVFCFVLSLSFGNVIENSTNEFKEKNTAFNNGYVKLDDNYNETFKILKDEPRLENVYLQYKLSDFTFKYNDKTEKMDEKYPMAKPNASMSYGVMPRLGKNEIAISPSLAKKLDNRINELVGKEIKVEHNGKTYDLIISGIFNGDYDDFFISSDIEQQFYTNIKDKPYSISYDVKSFEDVVAVSQMLNNKNIKSINASTQVEAFQTTFKTLNRLFLIVSALILCVGLFISSILLVKQQNSRYKEVGLMSALGFNKKEIKKMIISENLLLALLSAALNIIWVGCTLVVSNSSNFQFSISGAQIISSIVATFVVIVTVSLLASHKLLNTEPAEALRK